VFGPLSGPGLVNRPGADFIRARLLTDDIAKDLSRWSAPIHRVVSVQWLEVIDVLGYQDGLQSISSESFNGPRETVHVRRGGALRESTGTSCRAASAYPMARY
jgi:hypothetical protein